MTKFLKDLPIQLFFLAHTVSMALMELLGWPLLVFGLTQFRMKTIANEQRKTIWFLLALSGIWSLGQLINLPNSDTQRLLSGMPWVLLLWGLFGVFHKIGYQKGIKSISVIFWTLPIIAIYSVHQMFYGWDFIRHQQLEHMVGQFFRAIGFFNMPLTFAYVLGIWGCMALGQASAEKRFSFINIVAIFSSAICVLASSTRGGWVAFAVVLFFSFFFFSRRQKILTLVIAAILTVGFLLLY